MVILIVGYVILQFHLIREFIQCGVLFKFNFTCLFCLAMNVTDVPGSTDEAAAAVNEPLPDDFSIVPKYLHKFLQSKGRNESSRGKSRSH